MLALTLLVRELGILPGEVLLQLLVAFLPPDVLTCRDHVKPTCLDLLPGGRETLEEILG